MNWSKNFEKAIVNAARDGAKDLVLKQAREVRSRMGARGAGISFSWHAARGSNLDALGNLNVRGPCDEVVAEFHKLLRTHMGQ